MEVSVPQFYQALESGPFSSLLSQTHALIKSSDSINQSLKLWEIRLLLLTFNNQIQQAKQEAINLNNAIYLSENNGVPPPNAVTIQSSSPHSSTVLTRLYPLPKNNDGLINHRFLMLLLRFKSVPNSALINDFYKLCYQLRLKASVSDESAELSVKLTNLTYDIMVILIINKNYVTLLNFLQSLAVEHGSSEPELLRVELLSIITKMILFHQRQTPVDQIKDLLVPEKEKIFKDIMESEAGKSFLLVLNTINPFYSPDAADEFVSPNITGLGLDQLIDMVAEGKITGRILCSLLGVWDLSNNFSFEVRNEDGWKLAHKPLEKAAVPTLDDCYCLVNTKWCENINRVYGLE